MEGLDFIKQEALKHGACDKVKSVSTVEAIVNLLFTPQGREFCLDRKFPSLDYLRKYKDVYNQLPGIYIDCGEVFSTDILSLAVGDTQLHLTCNTPDYLFKTIVMYGASVLVEATNFAVVTATNIEANIDVNTDGSCIISVEQNETEDREIP